MTHPTPNRRRDWLLTWFNMDREPVWNENKMSYLVYEKETCPTSGRLHWQIYMELHNPHTLGGVKRLFDRTIHCQGRRGTPKQAADYCKKNILGWDGGPPQNLSEPFREHGALSRQGERTDLRLLRDQLNAGERTVQQIRQEDPMIFHLYGRTLQALEDDANGQRHRTTATTIVWIWGPTGTGKSHAAFSGEFGAPVYKHKYTDGWWDHYNGQPVVLFDDFRGQIRFDELLRLADRWPETVSRRGRAPVPFVSHTIVITSPLPPREVYTNLRTGDSIDQLLRRIREIRHLTVQYVPPAQ